MKKILFIIIALVTLSTTIYASFPVTEQGTVVVDSNNQPVEAPASSVDWTMFWLCLGGALIGLNGIHRMYAGQVSLGILMLLTAGGCGIWFLIDLINIISGKMSS